MAINFTDFSEKNAAQVFNALGLQLQRGMTLDELRRLFGEPVSEHRFAKDRTTYEFVIAGPPTYNASCTVLHSGGLFYIVIMIPLPTNPDV